MALTNDLKIVMIPLLTGGQLFCLDNSILGSVAPHNLMWITSSADTTRYALLPEFSGGRFNHILFVLNLLLSPSHYAVGQTSTRENICRQ